LRIKPVLVKLVVFAPTKPICVKLAPSGERSILNPLSFDELSFHPRVICVLFTVEAVKLEGALGTAGVGVGVGVAVGVGVGDGGMAV
jgi:hypothetical protein